MLKPYLIRKGTGLSRVPFAFNVAYQIQTFWLTTGTEATPPTPPHRPISPTPYHEQLSFSSNSSTLRPLALNFSTNSRIFASSAILASFFAFRVARACSRAVIRAMARASGDSLGSAAVSQDGSEYLLTYPSFPEWSGCKFRPESRLAPVPKFTKYAVFHSGRSFSRTQSWSRHWWTVSRSSPMFWT